MSCFNSSQSHTEYQLTNILLISDLTLITTYLVLPKTSSLYSSRQDPGWNIYLHAAFILQMKYSSSFRDLLHCFLTFLRHSFYSVNLQQCTPVSTESIWRAPLNLNPPTPAMASQSHTPESSTWPLAKHAECSPASVSVTWSSLGCKTQTWLSLFSMLHPW